MIDPSKYGDKIQYYEAIRRLFVKVGKYFGVEYDGLTIDEALNESVFDKFTDEEITSQDVEVVSLLYLADLIHQLSINLPEGDYETKARLTAFDFELKRLQESITSIAGKETQIIKETTEVKTLDLTALDGIKAKMLQLQSSVGDVKTLEIKQLSNSIKMNEIMTELDSITEQIQLLAQEFNTWKNKKAVLIKGGNSGASFGSQVSIQFRDEGVALGTAGTVNEMDFVGAGVSAVRVGNKVTVTINGGGGSISESFETISKNLSSLGATFNYTTGVLTSIVYANGITKTLNYTSGVLTSVVLSGATPGGIFLTKTLNYTSGNLTSVSYS